VNTHVLARTMLIKDHHKLTNSLRQLHKERLELIPNKISKPNCLKLLMMLLEIFKNKLVKLLNKSQ
jgi:hypothetical protein